LIIFLLFGKKFCDTIAIQYYKQIYKTKKIKKEKKEIQYTLNNWDPIISGTLAK